MITAFGTLGNESVTESPGPMPWAVKAAAQRSTSSSISAYEIRRPR